MTMIQTTWRLLKFRPGIFLATIFFRGREMAHPDFGRRILDRLMEDLDGIAVAEAHPSMQGNQMHIILSGVTGTKKGQEV